MAPFDRSNREREQGDDEPSILGVLFFGLIGATATTIAAGRLRTTIDKIYNQLKSHTYSSRTSGASTSNRGSNAWNRYNRRMQEEYEEEMERLERIRRMQNVFNRGRSKQKKTYETWKEHGPGTYQHFQRDDWYWKTDTSYKDRRTTYGSTTSGSGNYILSHHYSVLGLDRCRTKPYSDAEIKTAFRAKAMEYHPDQNQGNKEAAEAKFKEVMISYDAIKSERKNGRS
ncbi:uncharacterized protein A4U43_C03F7530 [Asparagus officinalis]|uniref:J domain-containing protein n=1 Tax=Asparagus officinalis TaxID=4686 RepID=A0A5P1FAW3_ASPOF|nr:uncharacterized protein LOC109833190 [Asparagus officinalis]ONK74547.1 uncharacterized protein A4U43_C03F7530 [Asparagus officinalis]